MQEAAVHIAFNVACWTLTGVVVATIWHFRDRIVNGIKSILTL